MQIKLNLAEYTPNEKQSDLFSNEMYKEQLTDVYKGISNTIVYMEFMRSCILWMTTWKAFW